MPTLQTDLTVERSRQDDLRNERVIDRTILGAQAVADLTRTVDLTLAARTEIADVTGAGAADVPDPDEDIYEILVAYRPSPQLTAEVQLEWRDTFVGSGLDRRLRFDWIPFRDGALDLQFDVQRLDNGLLEEKRDQYLLLSRWTLGRDAFLELNWALQKPENEPSAETVSLALNVSF